MSYASDVKKELTTLEVHFGNAKAELMALIRMNGAVSIINHHFVLNIQTENPAIARRIYQLLKKFYDVESELLVRRKMKLKKNNLYIVRLKRGSETVLNDLKILDDYHLQPTLQLDLLTDDAQIRSYLRGAFLAAGSVNNPETSRYHLEIYSLYEEQNNAICQLINRYGLNARKTERRSGYITYLKEAEKIADFLSLIGATNAMLKFEDIRIVRDMRNSVNRIVNCENANMNKVADAANRQIENIKYLDERMGLNKLPPKLQDVARTRVTHPEISLKELGEIVPGGPISKSGVNHRLRKLNELATKMRAGLEVSEYK
ncbi:DNA-binding protein WhiA [Liquorilactobacillus satsumensis]|uniref:Probable cell division protein WhiA n=1 Tax=Liquorilactobacillus satsumensis DSM 16230 = JCM 12392 TaxID=1423801 RepID=A0A0R1V3J0_9LACO|nr:DNA-binding protein WhiA [Liquorilactobacillus satsumensis]KRM00186.1 sporulation transcription regulator whiA [Liquorilactobacillus satsumensis DSM 16230 = JCM 12392]MCC7665747.1 DNA-binding protein WhiA [Liquorilactobacillus satsumensis]MCP9313407.1 DNA-binding protein WhiA [Liquorilactobacillus satsumensis]MCP9328240.1 DNA-binding protein WhiA [Liquorilactobacillus satsumensis]MCP9356459.1 DNA-binding protein WhiA [Liquorilactobacillus satsumensis]